MFVYMYAYIQCDNQIYKHVIKCCIHLLKIIM